jgi:hypothetical protein
MCRPWNRPPLGRSFEHDGAVVVDEDLVLQVRVHGARQDESFESASLADHVFHRFLVTHCDHVLRDDWV